MNLTWRPRTVVELVFLLFASYFFFFSLSLTVMLLNLSFCLYFLCLVICSAVLLCSFSFVSCIQQILSVTQHYYNCVIHFMPIPYVLVVVPRILVYDVYELGAFFNLFSVVGVVVSFVLSFHSFFLFNFVLFRFFFLFASFICHVPFMTVAVFFSVHIWMASRIRSTTIHKIGFDYHVATEICLCFSFVFLFWFSSPADCHRHYEIINTGKWNRIRTINDTASTYSDKFIN